VAGESTERVIRASEIGRYAFCARAWWLESIEGQPSTLQREMADGERAHHRHGRQVQASVGLSRLAYLLLLLAIAAAIAALLQAT
jgi:hypothetical protein